MVCVEALAVKTLLRHQRLAKAISAVGWGKLVRRPEYQAAR